MPGISGKGSKGAFEAASSFFFMPDASAKAAMSGNL